MGTDEALERLLRYGAVRQVGSKFVAVPVSPATEELRKPPTKLELDRPSGWKGVAV
jgi:hypothetical protein